MPGAFIISKHQLRYNAAGANIADLVKVFYLSRRAIGPVAPQQSHAGRHIVVIIVSSYNVQIEYCGRLFLPGDPSRLLTSIPRIRLVRPTPLG
jgi:hypothetical protein